MLEKPGSKLNVLELLELLEEPDESFSPKKLKDNLGVVVVGNNVVEATEAELDEVELLEEFDGFNRVNSKLVVGASFVSRLNNNRGAIELRS